MENSIGDDLNRLARIKTLSKMVGGRAVVRKIGEARPEEDPHRDSLIYVPLPEYGIALWYYINETFVEVK